MSEPEIGEDAGTESGSAAASEGEPPVPRRPPSMTFLIVVAVISAVLDLASKYWAEVNLQGFDEQLGGPKRFIVIEGFFDFVYAENPGGAWSMLRGLPEIYRRPFFLAVSSVAIVFIGSVYRRIDRGQWALVWGLPLALGGALGNLVDRARYGYVVDFIHFWMRRGEDEIHWPTFNVADVFIVVGVLMMAVDLMFSKRHRAEPKAEDEAGAEEDAPAAGPSLSAAEPGTAGAAIGADAASPPGDPERR